MKFIKDTLATFSALIVFVLAGLVTNVLVARFLGPSGKGAYALIILVPTVIALVANLGIGVANLYFGGKKKYDIAQMASNSLVSALLLGLLSSAAFLAYFFVFRPSFLSEVEPLHLVLAVAMVPFSLLASYFGHMLLGQDRIRQYNLLQVMPNLVTLMLMLVLLFAFHGGVLSTVMAWVAGVLVSAIVSALLILKLTGMHWSFERRVFIDSIKFGVQGYMGNFFQFLNYRVDMLIVAYFMTISDVGYYSCGVLVAEALWYFPSAVGTMVQARTPRLSEEEANRTTPSICRTTVFITIVAALALFGLGRYVVIALFGREFLPAVKPLRYLLPGVVALSVCKVLSNELIGRGKPIINAVVAALSLAVNIPLNFLLVPRMGIAGAALASTVSYSLSAIVTLIAFLRLSRNGWFDTLIIKPEDLRLCASLFGALGRRLRALATCSRE